MSMIRVLLFCALSVFSAVSAVCYADDGFAPVNPTKPNGLPNTYYPDLRPPIDRRLQELKSLDNKLKDLAIDVKETRRQGGGRVEFTLQRHLPVPYDPNHPNVIADKKEAKGRLKAKAKVLAGRLGRGLNALALGVAVFELLGDGVDWVLDPDNNAVVYKTYDGYVWTSVNSYKTQPPKFFPTMQLAAQDNCNHNDTCARVTGFENLGDDIHFKVLGVDKQGKPQDVWTVVKVKSDDDDKLPLETIADHIINNEDEDPKHKPYVDAVTDTLTDQITGGQHDPEIKDVADQLRDDKPKTPSPDKQTPPKDDKTVKDDKDDKTKDDDEDGSGKLQFPEFCDWAKPVCEFFDWFKEEPQVEPDELPEKNLEIKDPSEFDKSYLNVSRQCPSDIVKSFNTGFSTHEIRFEMMPICQFASNYMRPVIVFIAYMFAVIHISGAFRVG